MKPEFYEVVASDYDSYQRLGFFKTIDECMLIDFNEVSWTSIHDAFILAYVMKDDLPVQIGKLALDVHDLELFDLEFANLGIKDNLFYNFDDALVVVRVPLGVEP